MARYVRWFEEFGIDDVALVGGKNASLGEMYRELTPQGIKVPNGFAVTAEAYRDMLTAAGAWEALHEALDGLDPDDVADLARRGARARAIVYGAPLPKALKQEILDAYHRLEAQYGEDMSVAVRSSATAEDLPTASFAGQQETYLNITGPSGRVAPHPGQQEDQDGLCRGRRQGDDPQRAGPGDRSPALLHQRRGRAHPGRLRHQGGEALQRQGRPREAHGHGMGQGRNRRAAVHGAGPAGDRGVAEAGQRSRAVPSQGRRRDPGPRLCHRHQDRRRPRAPDSGRGPSARIPARRGAGGRHHHPRLGTGDEDRRRHRHQPRRAHLPCRHRGPGTWNGRSSRPICPTCRGRKRRS